MKFVTVFLALGLLTLGCNRPVAERPATDPTKRPATQPSLKAVDFRYGVYLARLEVHVTITPDGLLRSVRTENKSYGPNDIDPKSARIEMREGQLNSRRLAELAGMFSGWDSLSSEPYAGVPDGPELEFRYGERTVSSGGAPTRVWDAVKRIEGFAATMPVVGR